MRTEVTIHANPLELEELGPMLALQEAVEDAGQYESLWEATANFGNGYEADITVYNSPSGPWIDAVLFLKGCEIDALEPVLETVLGKHVFHDGDDEFVVNIV